MNFTISQENAQLVLNTLLRYPAGEVIQAIDILRTLEESPLKVDPGTGEKYLDMGGGARMSFGGAEEPPKEEKPVKEEDEPTDKEAKE